MIGHFKTVSKQSKVISDHVKIIIAPFSIVSDHLSY